MKPTHLSWLAAYKKWRWIRGNSMNQSAKYNTCPFFLSLLLVGAAGLSSGCVGCASSTLPPRLSIAEKEKLRAARLPLTVGVERCEAPAYSDDLIRALRNTKVFARVDHLKLFSNPPSLVARVERKIYGSTSIPVATLLTFGVIPTSVEEDFGYSFSLSPPDRRDERVFIEYSYRGRTTLGWIALFKGLLPGVAVVPFDPEASSRFRKRLALAILDHSDTIWKLAQSTFE